jgi:hypothetical protein
MIYKINELIHRQSKEYSAAKKKSLKRLPAYVFAECESETHPCGAKNLLPKLQLLINSKQLIEI